MNQTKRGRDLALTVPCTADGCGALVGEPCRWTPSGDGFDGAVHLIRCEWAEHTRAKHERLAGEAAMLYEHLAADFLPRALPPREEVYRLAGLYDPSAVVAAYGRGEVPVETAALHCLLALHTTTPPAPVIPPPSESMATGHVYQDWATGATKAILGLRQGAHDDDDGGDR